MADLELPEHTQSNISEKNLEYISQSNDSYTVKSEVGTVMTIAKAYIRNRSTRGQYEFYDKLMQIASLGLPIGGFLTIILSPLVFWNNVVLLKNEKLHATEKVHAKNQVIVSVIFFLLGLAVFVLFIMHLLY